MLLIRKNSVLVYGNNFFFFFMIGKPINVLQWTINNLVLLFIMNLLKTALLAVFFGSLYTIFRKYQSIVELSPQDERFNQPLQSSYSSRFQSFIIFIGMSTILCFRPWLKPSQQKSTKLPSDNMTIYLMPSLLDVMGTIVDTSGLYYVLNHQIQTSVSVSQMLKGSVIFFTYIITLFYLKKTLSLKKHLYMLVILGSLALIGASNVSSDSRNKCTSMMIQSRKILCWEMFLLFFRSFCSV